MCLEPERSQEQQWSGSVPEERGLSGEAWNRNRERLLGEQNLRVKQEGGGQLCKDWGDAVEKTDPDKRGGASEGERPQKRGLEF